LRGDFRIGDWVVHPHLNALERNGEMLHLEPKGMQVLLALASEPGEVCTRGSLLGRVWPDVLVGEDVLVRAISRLRHAFKDEDVIQTVHKVGYRLTAPVVPASTPVPNGPPVEILEAGERDESAPAALLDLTANQHSGDFSVPRRSSWLSFRSHRLFWLGSSVAASAIVLALLVLTPRSNHPVRAMAYITRPLTTDPGSQIEPSFSPDGKSIAFDWLRPGKNYRQVYVQSLASRKPVQLTPDESADQFDPVWSPNGRLLAFVRKDGFHSSIVLVPSGGGSEREVYTLPVNSAREYGGLAWSADGENLIFPQQDTQEAPSYLVELSLRNGAIRTITVPPRLWDGDFWPEVSPDGSKLAFIRGSELLVRDIYVMNLPDGPVRQVTHNYPAMSLAWSDDNTTIIFPASRNGALSLWRVKIAEGQPERVAAVGDDAYGPAIAPQGHQLVYSHGSAMWGIFAANLIGSEPLAPKVVLTSSEEDALPRLSPSGDRIAFQSWRSGSREIWTALMDGSNPVQLTNRTDQSAGNPSWSPDGRWIAFDARADSFAHVYIIDANGGGQKAITGGSYNDVAPNWSADGRWIYFGSNRSGFWQIWKVAVDGSHAPQQVTTNGGMISMVSPDGRWLYFSKYAVPGIWRQPLSGGPEHKLFDGPQSDIQNDWTVFRDAIYALSSQSGKFTLDRINPETGQARIVGVFNGEPSQGLSVSTDGKLVVFGEIISASSHLTLVDNFY
jgi:Tol biopolymer transport system component/DNA-binding winged helix-turn-helix (wHTH) protein